MTKSSPESVKKAQEQADRRADALRDNLKRRKDQARGRAAPPESKDTPT